MSATTFYWTDDDGDHDIENPTGNNWKTAAGVAAGAGVYPGSAFADGVVFPSWAAGAPTTNINQSDSANGIVNLTVEDGYAYGGGTREAPMIWKVAGSPVWTFRGDDHGDLYLVSTAAALVTVNVLKTKSSADALHLVPVVAITTLNVAGGNLVLDSALAGNTSAGAATINTSLVSGVALPQVAVDCPITTVLTNRGAKVTWKSGTITALNNYSGDFLCAGSLTARTLTASTCYGGSIDLRTGVPGTITLTAAIAYQGGAIYFDLGENLQRS